MRRRNRPASRPLSNFQIVATAGTALFVAVALIWLALVSPRGVPGIGYRYLNAQFKNAGNVPISTEIRIGGTHAGQVTGATLRNGIATLRLQLLPGDVPIHSDATARIGLKGLLGGKYVELDPGHARSVLPDGATLRRTQTATALDVLDVVQGFDAPHRLDLQETLQGLGKGLLGRAQDISEILHDAAPVASNADAISTAILDRSGAAARLFPSAESLAAAFEPVRKETAAGLGPEADAVGIFANRRADIQRTLDLAPSALDGLRSGLDAATPLLDEVAGLARNTTALTRPAPDALDQTAALLKEAVPALHATSPLLRTLESAVPPTTSLMTQIDPITRPATRALVGAQLPLAQLGRRSCDLQAFANNWRSMLGFGVAPTSSNPNFGLGSDEGLGAIDSTRLIVGLPPASSTLGVGGSPAPGPTDAYPGACLASGETAG